jgi:hypothetical protein
VNDRQSYVSVRCALGIPLTVALALLLWPCVLLPLFSAVNRLMLRVVGLFVPDKLPAVSENVRGSEPPVTLRDGVLTAVLLTGGAERDRDLDDCRVGVLEADAPAVCDTLASSENVRSVAEVLRDSVSVW